MKKLRGTYTVILTPFTEDGSAINESMLRWLVDFQISEGIHGIITLASNGEFLSLSDEERHQVASIVVDQAAGRVPVVVGTAAESTTDVIRYTKDAESLGADAAMVLTPYYCWIDENEIYAHYRQIAEAVSLPIMLYNHPASTVLDMKPPLIARLAEIDNISYIKESTTDTRRVYQINDICGDKITVFAGYLGYESFMVGAEGWVSVCANIMPSKSAQMFELAVDRNDKDAAWSVFKELVPIIDFLGDHLYVHGMKAAFKMMGRDMGNPRPPRLPLPADKEPELRAILNDAGLLDSELPPVKAAA
ncbi:MAG: 4-hydroxy-tetrahydrodipicolinate synthase [Acidiferrobacteraceae bacterium]|nr:4-hydroxy-tetrahydrodipicolinate synthase [Acidiferrobacteraceae bacterium]